MFLPTDSLPSHKSTHPHPIVWGGVGWGHNVIGISTWSGCYVLWSSLAFSHEPDATLYDLHWHSDSGVGWGGVTWSWCYALWSSLAFSHEPDATLYDLHWHFHMILMLRSMIFNRKSTHPHPIVWGGVGWGDNVIGISTWSGCYALWSSLAFSHEPDATLYDLHWHFHMILMLRSMIFNRKSTHPHPIVWGGVGWGDSVIGISTWSGCYALWSSLAFSHEPDATLYDLHWHFHMILMLRSTHPHDLHWHFHMILMLRSMIFNCNSTHPHPIVWGGVGWGGMITSMFYVLT